jgi:hypothetical protein
MIFFGLFCRGLGDNGVGRVRSRRLPLAKIIVENDDWNGARAKLQSSFDTQRSDFSAKMKAAFAPTQAAVAEPAAKAAAAPAEKSSNGGLPRFRRSS